MCPIPPIPRQSGRRGFAGQFIQDITAAASVATGQSRYHTIPFDGHTGAR